LQFVSEVLEEVRLRDPEYARDLPVSFGGERADIHRQSHRVVSRVIRMQIIPGQLVLPRRGGRHGLQGHRGDNRKLLNEFIRTCVSWLLGTNSAFISPWME
jgi:hypothetical protein